MQPLDLEEVPACRSLILLQVSFSFSISSRFCCAYSISSLHHLLTCHTEHWDSDESIRRFVLSPESSLYQQLCNPDEEGSCRFRNTVSLNSNLPCYGQECRADDVIIIQVLPGAFYEYIRQPCVHLSFYDNAKKVVTGFSANVPGIGRRHTHAMCANPKVAAAARSCCDVITPDIAEYNYKMEVRTPIYCCLVSIVCIPRPQPLTNDICSTLIVSRGKDFL